MPAVSGDPSSLRRTKRVLATVALFSLLVSALPEAVPADQGKAVPIVGPQTPSPPPSSAAPSQNRAFVTLIVNGKSFDNALVVILTSDILVRVADLQSGGVPITNGLHQRIAGTDFLSLNSLRAQLTYALDQKALALNITLLNASLLGKRVIDLGPSEPKNVRYVDDHGFFLNYALSAGTRAPPGGFFEAGLDFSHALLISSFQGSKRSFQRQITQLIYDSRAKTRRTIVGEAPISTGSLGGGGILAGISVQRRFDLNPYAVLFPTPTLSGSVLTPSRADVYVNGQLARTIDLEPGEFTLTDIPAQSGYSKTEVVVRDAFGNTKRFDTTFLSSAGLLRRGLTDYAFGAGLQRTDLFSGQTGYRQFAFAGRYALGISDHTTIGLRLEGNAKLASGGFSVAHAFGPVFVSAAAGQSVGGGLSGSAGSLSLSIPNRKVGASAFVTAFSPHYSTISLKPDDPRDPVAYGASVAFSIGKLGAISLLETNTVTSTHDLVRSATVIFQKEIARGVGMFVGYNRSQGGRPQSPITLGTPNATSISIGFVAQLRRNLSLSLSQFSTSSGGVTQSGTSIGFSRSNDSPFGLSLSGQITPGLNAAESVSLLYRGRSNNVQANIVRDKSGSAGDFSIGGALAIMGGHFFMTRPIADAFGLVVAPNLKGADVFANGRYEGRTNRSGFLLVPDLTSGSPNKVTLTPTKASFDQTFSQNSDYIVPNTRGAAFFRYNVTTVHAILGTISFQHKGGQTEVPVFGEVTMAIDGHDHVSEIDQSGRFYFDDVHEGRYTARVAFKTETCEVSFVVPARTQIVLRIGALTCVAH